MAELGRAQAGLRVGVAVKGKLVTERTLALDQDVTVGPSSGDTLIVPGVKGSVRVFSRTPKGLALAPEVRTSAKVRRGDAEATLAQGDRGRIDLAEVTVLYQSVVLPPRPLPVSFAPQSYRPRWLEDDDPMFVQSLVTWSALGLLLGIYVGTAPETRNVGEDALADFLTRLPPPVYIDREEPPVLEMVAVVEVPAKPKRAVEQKAVEPTPKPRTEGERARDIAKAKESIEARMMKAGLIGSTGESTWEIGVDEAIALDSTVETTGWHGEEQGLRRTRGGIGAMDVEVAGIGDGGSSEIGGGPNVFVAGAPKELEQFPTTTSAEIKKALKRYAPQVRYCYERELKRDPKLGGRIEMGALLQAGRPIDVWTESQTVGSSALEQCIHERVQSWTFPAEASGEIFWPYVFSAAD
ncbi:MAG: AgmX/PglI C-terminal domain-containing protein [Myxococcota bacterium]